MKRFLAIALLSAAIAPPIVTRAPLNFAQASTMRDAILASIVDGPRRTIKDRARDVYRKPADSLQFWGLKPGLTVVDLQPEGGYYAEILAPYAARTGGTYIAGVADPSHPWGADLQDANLPGALNGQPPRPDSKPADTAYYGAVRYAAFGSSGLKVKPSSIDIIFSLREVHNWIHDGFVDTAMKSCFVALKPGGVLAVEEHRAEPQIDPKLTGEPFTGYVPTKVVIAAAEKAGFVLDGTSELNANPKDIKTYPFGVWTLPPGRLSQLPGRTPLTAEQRAAYDAIGESDRMTLRFRKPLHRGAARAGPHAGT
jgi:predicted methyltransferase